MSWSFIDTSYKHDYVALGLRSHSVDITMPQQLSLWIGFGHNVCHFHQFLYLFLLTPLDILSYTLLYTSYFSVIGLRHRHVSHPYSIIIVLWICLLRLLAIFPCHRTSFTVFIALIIWHCFILSLISIASLSCFSIVIHKQLLTQLSILTKQIIFSTNRKVHIVLRPLLVFSSLMKYLSKYIFYHVIIVYFLLLWHDVSAHMTCIHLVRWRKLMVIKVVW